MEWQHEIYRLSEITINDKYYFFKNLKSLEIVIRAYSEQKHLFKKILNLVKNSESLWYLSHDSAPSLLPAPNLSL